MSQPLSTNELFFLLVALACGGLIVLALFFIFLGEIIGLIFEIITAPFRILRSLLFGGTIRSIISLLAISALLGMPILLPSLNINIDDFNPIEGLDNFLNSISPTTTYVITTNEANARSCPKIRNYCLSKIKFKKGDTIYVTGTEEGDEFQNSTTWLRINHKGVKLYVHSALASLDTKTVLEVPEEFNEKDDTPESGASAQLSDEILATEEVVPESSDEVDNTQENTTVYEIISNQRVNGRTCSTTTCSTITGFEPGERINVVGIETGESINGNSDWLQVEYNNTYLYVHSSLAQPVEPTAEDTDGETTLITEAQYPETHGIHMSAYCQAKGYDDAWVIIGDAYSWECYNKDIEPSPFLTDFEIACKEVYGEKRPYATLEDAANQNDWKCSPTEGYLAPRLPFNYPPGAAQPVEKKWSIIKVNNGIGFSVACVVLDDNQLGSYTSFTVYMGWAYVDANGVDYYGLFADGQAGPYDIVATYNPFECGIP